MTVDIPFGLAASGPSGPAPERRPGSVRRTSSIDMRWPDGPGTQLRLTGRSRDLLTPAGGGAPVVLAEDSMTVGVNSTTRTIEDLDTVPHRTAVGGMIGARGGSSLRKTIAEVCPDEAKAGTPLYLLLDDIAGASLVAGFAYSRWMSRQQMFAAMGDAPRRNMEGICTGFQSGSGALTPDGSPKWNQRVQTVGPLPREDDPLGWHELDEITEISMRRARRIDVTVSGVIEIDSMFQDSSTVPGGGRVAVHEYVVTATADPVTGRLLSVSADPRVLPYGECPLASMSVDRIIGTPLRELRTEVLEVFPGTAGCTHLNDAMRALAEVPLLVDALG